MLTKTLLSIFIISIMFIAGCSEDSPTTSTAQQNGNLNLALTGLEDLGSTAMYEGWIMVNGSPVSTGTFTINSSGQLSRSSFEVNSSDLNGSPAFILTIEPNPDPSADPSNNKIMAGDFSGNTASLSVSHSAALGNDFSSAAGSYILATPTDTVSTNELSGVWFLTLPAPPQPGLQLPVLPTGWQYEGWVLVSGIGTPLSTGKFDSPSGSDMSAPYSGTLPAPPFPGEDLLTNTPAGFTFPTNLQSGTVVVSIEPNPDNSAAPFALKPLVASIPSNATDHTNYNLSNQSATNNPTGTATR